MVPERGEGGIVIRPREVVIVSRLILTIIVLPTLKNN